MKNLTNEFISMSVSDHKRHTKKLHAIYILLSISIIAWLAFAYQYNKCYNDIIDQEVKLISKSIKTKTANAQVATSIQAPEEMSMKEWIKWRVTSEGVNWEDFDCMVRHESNYNQYAINKNTNGTYDIGYLQINEVHRLPRETSFDYKKATDWAIKKIKHDGNMMAWYGYRNNCQ